MHGADDTYVGMLMTVHPVHTWTESQGNNTILAQDVKKVSVSVLLPSRLVPVVGRNTTHQQQN